MKKKSREESLLSGAREFCSTKGLNFTPMRQRVYLEIARHESIGAYEAAHNLSSSNKQINAVSVYRALEFLISADLVYKINSNKKYAISNIAEPKQHNINLVLICKNTGSISQIHSVELDKYIKNLTQSIGFDMTRAILEIEGDGRSVRREARG
ncbi:Fur family transcriptional regulator [Microvirga sp. 2MCAF38]|uniref:Fur family transcriptional regulator n=1 Tax=Microvirga sp. 2MCAF38 TaxID=3232989 RepID=UPI003F9A2FCA